MKNPVARLTDKAYAERSAQPSIPQKAGVSAELKPGVPPHEGSNTTHYSIVDGQGNAVGGPTPSTTGSAVRITAPGTGVLLNNEMDDFTAKVGVPNIYGLLQGEANAVAPGKTPLSSMSPTIVSKDGKPVFVTGTPGGSRIITVVLHSILNVIDYGMNVQEAADAPRLHNQWMPDVTNVERFALSPDTRKILEGMGHKFGRRAAGQPPGGDPDRRAGSGREAGGGIPVLWGERSAAEYRECAGVLSGTQGGGGHRRL